MLLFIAGMVIGACLGVVLAGLLAANGHDEPVIRTRRPETDPVGRPMRPQNPESR